MPRKRHVSRNSEDEQKLVDLYVMPRKRHVSRNNGDSKRNIGEKCHASQEACE